MRDTRYIVAAVVAAILSANAIEAAESPGRPASTRPTTRGPWPTGRMIDVALRRAIRDAARRNNMDPKQTAVLERQVMTRWPRFLKKHRPVLQQLVNEYLEVIIIGKPPSPEQAARWAKAFRPILAVADEQIEGTHRAVRAVLRPEQVERWDRDHQGYRQGKSQLATQIDKLARGQFDPRQWRTPFPKPGPEDRMPVRPSTPSPGGQSDNGAARADGSARSTDRAASGRRGATGPPRYGSKDLSGRTGVIGSGGVARPLDAWESYVKQYIKRHGLDAGQTNAAMAILKELKDRGKSYRLKYRAELKRLERAVAAADPAARPRFQAQLDQVRRPIDELFGELRSRLDGLLTESQRKDVR